MLRSFYTDDVIDELTPEGVTYHDIARACTEGASTEPPSILKVIFHDVRGSDAIVARWLADESRDAEIEAKDARRELVKLLGKRIGIELPEAEKVSKLRALGLRYVLLGEFRLDLRCPVPEALRGVPLPVGRDQQKSVRGIAQLLRSNHGDEYPALANRIETELSLSGVPLPPGALGAIDTFRFEERVLLGHCGELIVEGRYGEALEIVAEREHSFWLDRDLNRKAQWEACRRMAELGKIAEEVRTAIDKAPREAAAWIEAYTRKGEGWYRLDLAQRRLETWIARLDEEPEEKPLGLVRRAYDDVCSRLAERFCEALDRARWSVPGVLHQTHVHAEAVAARPTPVAWFLVDALRFEMGLELAERLPGTAEVTIRPALAALPSLTPIGMAALLPGASASFSVAETNGKLGARIDSVFMPDLPNRKKLLAARVPGAVDLALGELLSLQPSKLLKKIEGATLIVVRSQEIDQAGEAGTFQARQVMDTVIDNLVRAIRKLGSQGVEHSVVTADHGHLFFPTDRDESMRIDPPGGKTVELHRRCWIGRGGATPAGCVRVSAAALGYESDLDFIFPAGTGVFRAGGDLAYHHGGPSLQEIVIPVMGVRLTPRADERAVKSPVVVSGLPEEITNRIFSIVLKLEGLFPAAVKPLLVAAGQQVGAAGMAVHAELDRTSGNVTL
ncbi:MAG TPA: PglZ domain-containing protein, partial [Thermoanaerobaculia bacterium]|nr:PglZ domain-containing protein [Thermoanaerobaculia bacterium]